MSSRRTVVVPPGLRPGISLRFGAGSSELASPWAFVEIESMSPRDELCLVSEIVEDPAGAADPSPIVSGLRVGVARASGTKCPRCWIVRAPAGQTAYPELCARCAAVVS